VEIGLRKEKRMFLSMRGAIKKVGCCLAVFGVVAILAAGPAIAQDKGGDLAKQTQNPVSSLISVPFQNNTGFGLGPNDRIQNVLNIQPVIPVSLGNWNMINRTIAPLIYQPLLGTESDGEFGLGDINHTMFFSPADPGKLIWGVGPVISFPTATKDILGTDKWSLGPSLIALTMPKQWVIGGLVNNVWSIAGNEDRADVNSMLLQYFVNYNFSNGTYLTSAPIITANWEADEDKWIVPFGGGAGAITKIGPQPINLQVSAYYNVAHPENGPDWSFRAQLQLLFPK
jgi:hypothetical protein